MRKFLIADDHPLLREAVRAKLEARFADCAILESDSLDSTLDAIRRARNLTLMILDLDMPGCENFYGILRLRESYPNLPIIILSANEDVTTIGQVLDFGANGYLPKTSTTLDLVEAINTVLSGDQYVHEQFKEALSRVDESIKTVANKIRELTPKQYQVLRCVRDGLSNRDISNKLNVTEATVKAHIGSIFRKLDVKSRTQIIVTVEKLNLD